MKMLRIAGSISTSGGIGVFSASDMQPSTKACTAATSSGWLKAALRRSGSLVLSFSAPTARATSASHCHERGDPIHHGRIHHLALAAGAGVEQGGEHPHGEIERATTEVAHQVQRRQRMRWLKLRSGHRSTGGRTLAVEHDGMSAPLRRDRPSRCPPLPRRGTALPVVRKVQLLVQLVH